MGGSEQAYVSDAFATNWIAPLGPHVDGFERRLAEYTGAPHVAALSSGTAAIHLALILLGVKKGDCVICSSFTFSASANPILYQGATPVFIDSEKDTWNMHPAMLEHAIDYCLTKGKKPKAIIAVHLYGMPAKMDAIMELAGRHGIPVIEDAAEALGSRYKGRSCGAFGDFGVLSFNGNKIITTSGGGALISANEKWINRARFLATQARDPAPHYQHSVVGYNYRMSNVCAAIGRGQMEVLDTRVEQRRKVFEFYKQALGDREGIALLDEPEHCVSNRWLTCILVDPARTGGVTREHIRLALEAENIESRPLWKPMHLQPVFKNALFFGDGLSEQLFENGLCLPSGSNLSEDDLARVLETIARTLKR